MSRRKGKSVCWEATGSPLPAVICKGGFELTMVRRKGRAAIYRQHLPGGNPDHDAYEVILAQIRDTDRTGEPVEPYEGYPAAESWGKKGWTFTSLAKALQKVEQLAQKASRWGTVSRRKRFNGQTREMGRRTADRSRLQPARRRPNLTQQNLVNGEHGMCCIVMPFGIVPINVRVSCVRLAESRVNHKAVVAR